MPHWLLTALGLNSASGVSYLAWSGVIGDAGIVAALVAFYVHHTCHVSGCWWYARRKTAAGELACFRHHPSQRRTWGDIHAAHHAAVAQPAPVRPVTPWQADMLAALRKIQDDNAAFAETARAILLAQQQRGPMSR